MRDRHTREEADAKRLIKKGLTPESYLYEIPEPGERFEYIVVENDSSQKVGDKMEYPEVVRRLGKKIDISYYLKTVVSSVHDLLTMMKNSSHHLKLCWGP